MQVEYSDNKTVTTWENLRKSLGIVRTDNYSEAMNNSKAAGANQDTDAEIAARITNALIVRGIDKKQLAMRIGVSYSTLRRSLEQERGDNRSFTFRELGKIAEVLEVQPSTLIPAPFTEQAAA